MGLYPKPRLKVQKAKQEAGARIMKIYNDQAVDAAHRKFSNQKPSGVVEISEGIHVDVTDPGAIVGIEILDASNKIPLKSLFTLEYDSELLLKHQ